MKTSAPKVDARLWQKVVAHKYNQRLAGKAERIRAIDAERRALFVGALKVWASLVPLAEHFPGTDDLCTSEAVYRLDYCHRAINADSHHNRSAWEARFFVVNIAREVLGPLPFEKVKESFDAWANNFTPEKLAENERYCAQRQEQPDDVTSSSRAIEALEARLESLREHGDITDSTQCFQLEKRIYDLRREQEREEWPEFIDA